MMIRLTANRVVFAILVTMLGCFGLQQLAPLVTDVLCLKPRIPAGLPGILFAPLLHAGVGHLLGNLAVVLPTVWLLRELYSRFWAEILLFGWIGTGLLVWAGARASCHIGASGLGYALTLFLFVSGLLHHDRRSWALALLVLMLNQGWVWGILPTDPAISWESHLFGAVTGLALAFWYRKEGLPQSDIVESPALDVPDEVWDYRRHLPQEEETKQF